MTTYTAALPLKASPHSDICTEKVTIHKFNFKIAIFTYYEAYRLINYNSLQTSFVNILNMIICIVALPLKTSPIHWQMHRESAHYSQFLF